MTLPRSLQFWRRLPLRTQIFAGMLAPMLVLTLSAVLVYALLRPAHEELAGGERNIRAIALYSALYNAVLAAQTGERGFVITGQDAFRRPYHAAGAEFAAAMTELRQLEAGAPERLAALREIEQHFQRFLHEVADPVVSLRMRSPQRMFSTGFDTVAALDLVLVQSARGEPVDAGLARYTQHYEAAQQLGEDAPLGVGWRRTEGLHQRFLRQLTSADPADRAAAQQSGEELRHQLLALTGAAARIENGAAAIIASGHGIDLIGQIQQTIEQASAEHSARHAGTTASGQRRSRIATWLAVSLPIGAGLLGLGLMLAMQIDQARVIRKLRAAASAVGRDEPGKLDLVDRTDELGDLSRSFAAMAAELGARRQQMHNLDAFQSMLLSSVTADEAFAVTARACTELLPRLRGSLYLISASRNLAELASHWPDTSPQDMAMFEPDACRGLRAGHDHYVTPRSVAPLCPHNLDPDNAALCIPLASKGDVLGILAFRPLPAADSITPAERALANTIATRLSLMLANLRLAETLRVQSIRDPLTGCFNRRYLEETLEREVARARRAAGSLALLAIDADHFKRFNDQFGHDAGDLVLRELAQVLRRGVRTADIVCRYGGEEFVVVLPDADRDAALRVAEALRRTVAQLALNLRGAALGTVTISLGVALYPEQGATGEQLIQQADSALYRAKHGGRNRVELAAPPTGALDNPPPA